MKHGLQGPLCSCAYANEHDGTFCSTPVTRIFQGAFRSVGLAVLLLSACAAPYVQPPATNDSVPSLNDRYAVMSDGYRLPLRRWKTIGNSRAVVLAIHGLNDYSNAFASTGEYLAARGITLLAYDQRGFGATNAQGLWHGTRQLVDDARSMTRLIRQSYPDQPLYLIGESMGGGVILALLARYRPDINGVILLAPAVWSRNSMLIYQRFALWLAAHTIPSKQLTGKGLGIRHSDNTDMLRALGRDLLVIKATRVDVLYGVSNLMDAAVKGAPSVNYEMLILYGKNDGIIPKKPTCNWLRNLADGAHTAHWDTVVYNHGYHMLTRDLQAAVVLEDIADWILGGRAARHPNTRDTQESVHSFCAERNS